MFLEHPIVGLHYHVAFGILQRNLEFPINKNRNITAVGNCDVDRTSAPWVWSLQGSSGERSLQYIPIHFIRFFSGRLKITTRTREAFCCNGDDKYFNLTLETFVLNIFCRFH